MLKKLLTIAVFATISPALGQAETQPKPFDFKGITLGITLDEWRQIPKPSPVPRPNPKCICNPITRYPVRALSCKYGHESFKFEDQINLLGKEPNILDFDFVDINGTMRLHEISVVMSSDQFTQLLGPYRAKFGQPTREELPITIHSNWRVEWANPVSSLRLTRFMPDNEHSLIIYSDTRIDAFLKDLEKKRDQERANEL